MSANGNGGRYHYYACSGRQKYGPKACDGERLPREKIETAVIDQLATLYRDEQVISEAFARANADADKRRPEFEQRLASISAEAVRAEQALERYYEAFEQGKLSAERCEDRLVRLQARLDDLRAQDAELSLQTPDEAAHAPTVADLAEIANAIEAVATEGDPQRAKTLLRLLIDELRVNGRSEILPTYRLVAPEVCAMGGFNRWSQHPVMEVVRDGCRSASAGDSGDAGADMVAGPAVDGAPGGSAAVLASDRSRCVERGRCCRGGRVAGGWQPVVPRRWRDATNLVGPAVGALSVVR